MRPALVLGLLFSAAASAASVPKLAAPGLNGVGLEAAFASFAGEHLAQQLREAGLEVVTGSEIGAVLGLERQKEMLGCTAGACLTELANALGADGVVMGDLAQIGSKIALNVKVISARDARTLASYSSRVEGREALLDALTQAAKKMAPDVAKALGGALRAQGAGPAVTPIQERAVAVAAPVVAAAPEAAPPDAGPCGGAWCRVDLGSRRTSDGSAFELNGVWATSPENAWAVGFGATALRFDGTKWQPRNAPLVQVGVLTAVWGTGPARMIAVGKNGLSFQWKASGWQALPGAEYTSYTSISGLPDGGSIWAASDEGLHQLNGTRWQLAFDGGTVAAVSPAAANDVWAVGKGSRVLHFDGNRWAPVTPATSPVETKLNAVWANGPDDVWMVGDNGAVLHFGGKPQWSLTRPTASNLLAVWGTNSRNVWAAGQDGALLHFDGSEWVSVPAPSTSSIHGLAGFGEYDLWLLQGVDGVSSVVHLRR
jgi:hypothetical protein